MNLRTTDPGPAGVLRLSSKFPMCVFHEGIEIVGPFTLIDEGISVAGDSTHFIQGAILIRMQADEYIYPFLFQFFYRVQIDGAICIR